ncbi:hypothetical protein IK146_03050 [Candidatus Saccharibacteria bacterium]|nr:hypothetical protein [Candidatus Saccharibacteria bacterium]
MSFFSDADIVKQETGRYPEELVKAFSQKEKSSEKVDQDDHDKRWKVYGLIGTLISEAGKVAQTEGIVKGIEDAIEEDADRVQKTLRKYHGNREQVEKYAKEHSEKLSRIAQELTDCYAELGIPLDQDAIVKAAITKTGRDKIRKQLAKARKNNEIPALDIS